MLVGHLQRVLEKIYIIMNKNIFGNFQNLQYLKVFDCFIRLFSYKTLSIEMITMINTAHESELLVKLAVRQKQ